MDQSNLSRRDFIRKAGLGLAVATVTLSGCGPKAAAEEKKVEATQETSEDSPNDVVDAIPPSPWSYVNLDTELVRKKGHAEFYEGDCCYGAFAGVVGVLQESVGFPFTQIPTKMMEFGAGGVAGWGTTCGSLIGASAAINLVTDKDTAKKLVDQLLTWYTQTPFPSENSNQYAVNHEFLVAEYKSDLELPQSVSNSPLCHVSVTEWCQASGIASGAKERGERCARLTGDVAAKAVELLNANLAGTFSPVFTLSEETQGCMTCHTKGENFAMGQFTQGRMECTSCHEPHQ